MKKITSLILVVCVILSGFYMLPVVGEVEKDSESEAEPLERTRAARSNTLYVGSGQIYKKIQDAIDNATNGDTIYVDNGTYNENLVISKMISLIANGSNVIINGSLKNDVIRITANNVNISCFNITSSGNKRFDAGIELNNVKNCNISNNHFFRNSNGVLLNYSSNNNISDNVFESNFNKGVYIYSSLNNTIIDNHFSSNYGIGIREFGIYLELVSKNNTIISNNISSRHDYGVFLDSPPYGIGISGFNDDNDWYIDCIIFLNSSSGYYEYDFPGDGKFTPGVVDEYNSTRIGGDVRILDTGPKIGIWDSGDEIMYDPLASGHWTPSMQTISNHYTPPGQPHPDFGFRIDIDPMIDEEKEHTYNQSLTEWADDDGDWDVTLDDIGVDGLPATADPGEGDGRPTPGEPGVDEDFYVNVSKFGKPYKNYILYNNVSENINGLFLENTSDNIIELNTIENNYIGIYNQYSHNNQIYQNNFIQNSYQAYDSGNNSWNISTKGNYWSDWVSPDNNSDGIVDKPYLISGPAGAKDYYPLTKRVKIPTKPELKTNGTVIIVRTGQRFSKIQDAVDKAKAGDTIRVWDGEYLENVVLNKKLSLIGNGSINTIINGSTLDSGVTINADRCNISEISIIGNNNWNYYGMGIRSDFNNILNCSFGSNIIGIDFRESSNNTIENCFFKSNSWSAINVSRSDNNKIFINIFQSNAICIFMSGSNNNEIEHNNFLSSILGVEIGHASNNNMIVNNTFKNNSDWGVSIGQYCNYNSINNNNFLNNNYQSSDAQAYDWIEKKNNWNSSQSGNYWSDWTSPDNDKNGIVDIPYNISGGVGSKDYYPLVNPIDIVIPYPPSITTMNVLNAYVNKRYSVNYSADDLDTPMKNLTWTMKTNATWLNFSKDQELYGKPTLSDLGRYWVYIVVSDGENIDYTNFTLTVKNLLKPPQPQPGNGTVIILRTGKRFTRIQSAINNASSGDTIRVFDGTYNERLVVEKTLNIVGNGSNNSIIDGDRKGDVVTVKSKNCNINGFKITGSGYSNGSYKYAGIVINSDFIKIFNCHIIGNQFGMKIKNGNNFTINDTYITGSYLYALELLNSKNTLIEKCYFNLNKNGLLIRDCDGFKIMNSEYNLNGYGVKIHTSKNGIFENSTFNYNSYNCIYISSSSKIKVNYNVFRINGSAGVDLETSYNNHIYHNNFIGKVSKNFNCNLGHDTGSNNKWNTTTSGNYWDDWTTPDENNDGIVDLPYNISGSAGSKDYYPLSQRIEIDFKPPTNHSIKIESTSMVNNTYNISINTTEIKIIFSKPMNSSSVESALIINPFVNYTLIWEKNNTILRIVFTENLSYYTTYKISIGNSAKDNENNKLDSSFELIFTTEIEGDNDADGSIDGDHQNGEFKWDDVGVLVSILIIAFIIIILTFAIITKNRRKILAKKDLESKQIEERQEVRGEEITEEYKFPDGLSNGSGEFIMDLKDKALTTKKPSDFGPTKQDMLEQIQDKYQKGEISKDTYESVKEIISKREQ